MEVHLTWDDPTNVLKRFSVMPKDLDIAVKKGLAQVTSEMVRETTGPLGLSKYPRHKPGTKTDSPPGEPPAQITTDLRRSIRFGTARRKGFAFYEQDVDAGRMVYAAAQEFGVPGRLPKRPFLAPAFSRITSNRRAENIFADRIRDVLAGKP